MNATFTPKRFARIRPALVSCPLRRIMQPNTQSTELNQGEQTQPSVRKLGLAR
jgi:hypothetical protein